MNNLNRSFLGILFGIILILLSFRIVVYNFDMYKIEILKDNSENFKEDEVKNLINYFNGKEDLKFFNEKERMHLIDVKNLINKTVLVFYFLLIAFLITLYFSYKDFFKISAVSFLFILLLFGILYLFSFSNIFYKFHLIFFDNNLWLLNPETDKLIVLFPESFFFNMLKRIFYYSLGINFMTGLASYTARYLWKKFKY
ncbi:TIGR01906 family membrane protein [Candidatus Woesearchaeota archaeon]|nr:TIGR01906 family membrane protein [Candidatus Woesearchaeota archaeon]